MYKSPTPTLLNNFYGAKKCLSTRSKRFGRQKMGDIFSMNVQYSLYLELCYLKSRLELKVIFLETCNIFYLKLGYLEQIFKSVGVIWHYNSRTCWNMNIYDNSEQETLMERT